MAFPRHYDCTLYRPSSQHQALRSRARHSRLAAMSSAVKSSSDFTCVLAPAARSRAMISVLPADAAYTRQVAPLSFWWLMFYATVD